MRYLKCQLTSKYCLIHDRSERVIRGRVQGVTPGLLAGGRGLHRLRGRPCRHRDGGGAGVHCPALTGARDTGAIPTNLHLYLNEMSK